LLLSIDHTKIALNQCESTDGGRSLEKILNSLLFESENHEQQATELEGCKQKESEGKQKVEVFDESKKNTDTNGGSLSSLTVHYLIHTTRID